MTSIVSQYFNRPLCNSTFQWKDTFSRKCMSTARSWMKNGGLIWVETFIPNKWKEWHGKKKDTVIKATLWKKVRYVWCSGCATFSAIGQIFVCILMQQLGHAKVRNIKIQQCFSLNENHQLNNVTKSFIKHNSSNNKTFIDTLNSVCSHASSKNIRLSASPSFWSRLKYLNIWKKYWMDCCEVLYSWSPRHWWFRVKYLKI